jgi:hypothetical protein
MAAAAGSGIGHGVQEALWRGHELSMTSGTGRWCGGPPGPNAATMTRRPPQQGHGEGEDTRLVYSVGGLGVGCRRGNGDQFADAGDAGGAIAVSQKTPGSGPGQAA